MRNAATAQEAYFLNYKTFADSKANLVADSGQVFSDGVSLTVSGNTTNYSITAYHSAGNKTFVFTGPGGQITEKSGT